MSLSLHTQRRRRSGGGYNRGKSHLFIKTRPPRLNPAISLESLPPLPPPSAIALTRDSRLWSRCTLGAGSRCNRGNSSPRLSGPLPLDHYPLTSLNCTSALPLVIHPSMRSPDLHSVLQATLRNLWLPLMARITQDLTRLAYALAGSLEFQVRFPPSIFSFPCRI